MLVGLTEKGFRVYVGMWAVFQKFMPVAEETDPETGEPMFKANKEAIAEMARRMDALWARFGLKRTLALNEALAELARAPREVDDLIAVLGEHDVPPGLVRKAVKDLLRTDLATHDEDLMTVAE